MQIAFFFPQNFISLEPGRHIIREYPNIVEISFSTNKPKHTVHLFLLNDCLLIAVKKKRQGTSKAKLVADRCWELDDISLIDVKDTDGTFSSNCVNLNLKILLLN